MALPIVLDGSLWAISDQWTRFEADELPRELQQTKNEEAPAMYLQTRARSPMPRLRPRLLPMIRWPVATYADADAKGKPRSRCSRCG